MENFWYFLSVTSPTLHLTVAQVKKGIKGSDLTCSVRVQDQGQLKLPYGHGSLCETSHILLFQPETSTHGGGGGYVLFQSASSLLWHLVYITPLSLSHYVSIETSDAQTGSITRERRAVIKLTRGQVREDY